LEKEFVFESGNPVDVFGLNNGNIKLIVNAFPQLKINVRGHIIKAQGDQETLEKFDELISFIRIHHERFGVVLARDVKQLLQSTRQQMDSLYNQEDDVEVLVHGRNGKLIQAKTPNQHRIVSGIRDNDIVFAIGPAGTGKTYTAVALAVRALKNKEVQRIILTRPAVEAGENLGFLPGDLREKLDPYLQPLYDALRDMVPQAKLLSYLEENTIEIAPLAFMRGRTLNKAFVILDEAQNATSAQLKMFLTRMGVHAKFVVTGDITQIDLPKNQKSGLAEAQRLLKDIKGIEFVQLDHTDVVRHKLVTKIIDAYNK
jgi:phosphate starvation-inducible PhoH-like protein